MNKIPTYILSGGQSTRFKTDKARALYKNIPLITHMVNTITPFATSITVIADVPDKYQDLNHTTIPDILPNLGPIGGLYTALNHCPNDWLLLTSCDWLAIDPTWIKTLLTQTPTNQNAIAYHDKFWQPLLALYHKSTLPIVKKQIDTHNLSLQNLLNNLTPLSLPQPPNWSQATQINTPQQLKNHSDSQTP